MMSYIVKKSLASGVDGPSARSTVGSPSSQRPWLMLRPGDRPASGQFARAFPLSPPGDGSHLDRPRQRGRSPSPRRSPMPTMSLVAAQEQFTATLKAVEDAAGYAFRRRRRQDREEALAEARAAAWSAWHGLIRKGKDPVEVGV